MEKNIILEVKGMTKHFGGIVALDNVDLKLYEGEIVAIVGDNGAGKSTLIKTIIGTVKKNSGKIYINGKEVEINNINDAKKYGIETVFQESTLIPSFDAPANLFLGRDKIVENKFGKFFKFLDFNYMANETRELLKKLEVGIKDIKIQVKNYSGGQRQGILVGRAVYWGGKIIIFDEPTNNLGVNEQRKILDLIKKLRDEHNISIIIISHNLYHVFELVDRIVVLRNGMKVGERIRSKTNPNEIVSMITGLVKDNVENFDDSFKNNAVAK